MLSSIDVGFVVVGIERKPLLPLLPSRHSLRSCFCFVIVVIDTDLDIARRGSERKIERRLDKKTGDARSSPEPRR